MTFSGPIVVMGLMGAGKTTVATLLAEALGRRLRDSDPDLRARYGLTAAELAKGVGADELHLREALVLRDALDDQPPSVIAAAASTVEDPASREALRPAFVVFLDAEPEVLAERMKSGDHRPHFQPDLVRMLTEQRARRLPHLKDVADVIADAGTHRPQEIVESVLDQLTAHRER